MIDQPAKICCIGFQKTGTSSVAEALGRLGYRVTNVNLDANARLEAGPDDARAAILAAVFEGLTNHDVIQDSPGPFVYEELDRAYPGAKFIFTTRPFDDWIASYAKFFPDENNALRRWMYGVDRLSGNEARYRAVYEAQTTAIRAYFADRSDDFLEMDLSAGDGWYELVSFLGRDRLPRFPHTNPGTAAGHPARQARSGLQGALVRLSGRIGR